MDLGQKIFFSRLRASIIVTLATVNCYCYCTTVQSILVPRSSCLFGGWIDHVPSLSGLCSIPALAGLLFGFFVCDNAPAPAPARHHGNTTKETKTATTTTSKSTTTARWIFPARQQQQQQHRQRDDRRSREPTRRSDGSKSATQSTTRGHGGSRSIAGPQRVTPGTSAIQTPRSALAPPPRLAHLRPVSGNSCDGGVILHQRQSRADGPALCGGLFHRLARRLSGETLGHYLGLWGLSRSCGASSWLLHRRRRGCWFCN